MFRFSFRVIIIFIIIVLTGFHIAGAVIDVPDPNEGLFFIAPKIDVKIDGKLDEWEAWPAVHLNKKSQVNYVKREWRGIQDCSVKFWWGWNESGLIVAAETIDDSIAFPNKGENFWSNDCIQFVVDIQDDNSQHTYMNDDWEYVVTMNDTVPVVYEYSKTEHRESGVRDFPCKITIGHDTIRYEVLVPWNYFGLVSAPVGNHIGASLVAFDNDGIEYDGWLEWTTGITQKKFTLPFANILIFDSDVNMVQSIITQPFLSENDTLFLWAYSKYWKRNVSYQLFENDETLFKKRMSMRSKRWIKLEIEPKYLKFGRLKVEVNSPRKSHQMDIAIWSKQHITAQIAYLVQQVGVLKSLKNIDASSWMLVNYWVEWLQKKFSSADTDFDYYNLMNEIQKRIDQIPNFYMNKQVFYSREHRIVENVFSSSREERIKRYLSYLPVNFQMKRKYPLLVFLSDDKYSEDIVAREMGKIFTQLDVPVVTIFPDINRETGITHLTFNAIRECIADISNKYKIEDQQIYIIGEGIGGYKALILNQQYPDYFAALTMVDAKIDTSYNIFNLVNTPIWLFGDKKNSAENLSFISKFKNAGGKARFAYIITEENIDRTELYSIHYFKWLLGQRLKNNLLKIELRIKNLRPEKSYWINVLSQEDYNLSANIKAVVDSSWIFVTTRNVGSFSIIKKKLPNEIKYPLKVTIDQAYTFNFEQEPSEFTFYKCDSDWKTKRRSLEELSKMSSIAGPMAAVFEEPIRIIYSTKHDSAEFNSLSYKLARKTCQMGPNNYLDKLIVADTNFVKNKLSCNIIVFGNEKANAYLKSLNSKLPFQTYEGGLKFGNSYYTSEGNAALYIFPNPDDPNYLILVGIAPGIDGLKNIEKTWDISYFNRIFSYDFIVIENGVSKSNSQYWVDYGYFDNNWSVQWFQPLFNKSPKRWFGNMLLGLDANQLSFNGNWRGGGTGSYTWKIYSKMELKYEQKKYNWYNTLYCAFGQISVQENETWTSPEKSNDVIDFDSVLKFTLEKYIDPYVSFNMDTQFQRGYDSKTDELVSEFANPLRASQSAGMSRNLKNNKKTQLTTRFGFALKEFIAKKKQFRERWTGDETKWMKIDGGIEWTVESKSEFNSNITWTNKLKVFQATASSISKEKDPERNWRKTDVHWEQMFTAKLTQYVLFNVVMKFLYDKDTSKGGQFLENASLGVSYKFKGIKL